MTWLMRSPREILFGVGVASSAAATIARHGRRPLVCTDQQLAATRQFETLIAQLREQCGEVAVFDQLEAELPLSSVHAAAELGRGMSADVIVGFGGGSAIDLAKVTAAIVSSPGHIERFYGEQKIDSDIIPIIAIPTTAGTGSEVTAVAVVSDDRRVLKVGVSSERIIPAVALVDPALTLGCPTAVTTHSGADAICHAVEAFTARTFHLHSDELHKRIFIGKNEESDRHALDALELLSASLLNAIESPDDLATRSAMSEGSLLAGLAFGNAGTTAAHALQYPLGADTKTPHGLGVGLLLPYTLATILDTREAELASVAVAMRAATPESPAPTAARAAVTKLHTLMLDAGIPASLADIGVRPSDLPRYAAQAVTVTRLLGNHAIDLDLDAVHSIYLAAHAGRNPLEIAEGDLR